MLKEVIHIGLTVTDLDRSRKFYEQVLGLKFQGEMLMEGPETDRLFNLDNCRVRVAYFNGSDELLAPPIELLQFMDRELEPCQACQPRLDQISISEVCFKVEDIDLAYQKLVDQGVECLSAPQTFDFKDAGFGRSKALYFKDPDGIILELLQALD